MMQYPPQHLLQVRWVPLMHSWHYQPVSERRWAPDRPRFVLQKWTDVIAAFPAALGHAGL